MATGIDERTDVTGPDATPSRRRWLWPALAVLAFILAAGALGGPGGKLAEVEQNDAASHLPAGAEATRVLNEATRFTGVEATSAIVVSYYWHFVDVVWVGLFATIYLIR